MAYRKVSPIHVSSPNLSSLINHLESQNRQSAYKVNSSDWKLPKAPTQAEKDRQQFQALLKQQNAGHSHGSLLGGILDHLGTDVIDTIKGIPGGVVQMVEHPVSTGKAIVASYKDTYGNGWGHFKSTFEAHPLGPILDALTLVTGGAGAIGKVGRVAGESGLISKEARLAKLGEAGKVVVRLPVPSLRRWIRRRLSRRDRLTPSGPLRTLRSGSDRISPTACSRVSRESPMTRSRLPGTRR